VVASPNWNSTRGAVTWGNASIGITGIVSDANSLVGSSPGDLVGSRYYGTITVLTNGDYVVSSPNWNGNRGAVTWGNGNSATIGMVSAANSLVGIQPEDHVGVVATLRNGNYVVDSPNWNGKRGAVTWGNGSAGVTGIVSENNSLVGSNAN